ncbi:hypothetical protein AYO44_02145 [Planctomycetaceae bacterium SCGC AG-212-F19]|nr:hypothetical protein AYO44_02145 [Planctomycetaceae bacterium SCGC AG-212-F19]
MPPTSATYRCCDGITRRSVIQAGLAGVAGLSLADLLRFQAQCAVQSAERRDTAVIFVVQPGGAPQHETWDPKPDAVPEIRGEFAAIPTRLPGVRFSELMVEQARIADKLTVLRSVHHPSTQHSSSVHLIKTGYYCRAEANENEMPAVGAYAARVRGAGKPGLPPYVLIETGERYDGGHFLGKSYNPFFVKTHYEKPEIQVPNLTLVEGVTVERLNDRRALLAGFDEANRILDTRGEIAGFDAFQRQAYAMVTGPQARRAFNLDAEPLTLRERYGRTLVGQNLLLARRLVEHGVTFVTAGTFGWDYHGDLWQQMRRDAPAFDRAVATLITDLAERGLAERVLVVVMGEFGRTPKISSINNLKPGRDHWGDAMSVLLAGGGMPAGRAIGATDAKGAFPTEHPCRLEQVLGHVYRHLGIDPGLTFNDFTGRPRHLLEIREPIPQLM